MDINSMLLNKRNLLKQQLAEKYKLKWDFIPPYSPWFGEAEDKPVLTPHMLAKYREGWPLLPSSERYEYDKSDVKDRLIYHRGRAIADEIMCRFVKERFTTHHSTSEMSSRGLSWTGGKVRVIDVQLPDRTIITRYSAQRAAKLDICEREEPSVPTDSSPIKSPQHGEAN
ncbi:hypothetical protein PVAND_014704 [Polypedilum vanderplanki]|uniref:Uncharacterized protein n=1 Tax=Polypedilum vanderplanki TaxID=319348 RepID=A0A9J6B9Y4_POLVA|nr:hypothetical protein PVAND_014704 [Polypedilum vanderplanki]